MNRIEKKFKELKKSGKKAFIAFITAGYPNIKVTEKLVREFDRIGVNIVELGVPFSDPMADGPVIQESSQVALKHKVNLNIILKLVKRMRRQIGLPICLMTYYNPIFCFGEERFLKLASSCGVDGVIVPDLPPEEAGTLVQSARKYKLDVICFISPTTPLKRMRHISQVTRGFIYYVSLTGVTGARKQLPADLIANLKTAKKNTDRPLCVGFGVSNRKQVRQIYQVADGVIVGSAIVKKIKENIGRPDLIKRVSSFVKTLQL